MGPLARRLDVQMPVTSGGPRPLARLNVFREVSDGSDRLFANDLNGPLYVIIAGVEQVYIDLEAVFTEFKSSPGLATGFVSFAFHPDFANNGRFYTVHTENVVAGTPTPNLVPAIPTSVEHHSVLNEWQVADPADNLCNPLGGNPNCTQRELIRIAAVHRFHNMGEIAFDPNVNSSDPDYGLLYIGAGDYGAAHVGDPSQLQRLDTPYGVIMRIDPGGAITQLLDATGDGLGNTLDLPLEVVVDAVRNAYVSGFFSDNVFHVARTALYANSSTGAAMAAVTCSRGRRGSPSVKTQPTSTSWDTTMTMSSGSVPPRWCPLSRRRLCWSLRA